ncbi:Smr/MutS family protein [Sphingomonas sp. KR1UV-12]|uniref:Smr/MutS family protein n=1 Tax=Sphingomonas aurea TaxID=3063994 RepID=A0ABT9EI53_9SPHN|nr:Smr/MutS family protein [Sphingomonas sp. KR1UV-12]MDP1026655.1 Smr/MutS family protein [Sphingomonas sp. KR1UV-12]
MATVRPLRPVAVPPRPVTSSPPPQRSPAKPVAAARPVAKPAPRPAVTIVAAKPAPQNNLDGSWDRRLGRGIVSPDSSVDLHGHTLASAHALLDAGLDRAIRRGDRVLLLVTGKPPRPESERPHARGAIRAAVADWLAASRHADAIAAVRGAHPRHGGLGALYIVLRRPRGG